MKISVIMPVYNVEKYLPKAIESILNQTLRELEFFIVDDGSPDRCGEIADEYASKDDRITVIHKQNGGAPSARNTAIELASGKYMYFMDSDDWAEPDMLKSLYTIAEENIADLVISGFYMEYYESDKHASYRVYEEDAIYSTQQEFRENAYKYFNNTLLAVPWNKLYRSDYILKNNLRYPEIKWDDLHFNMDVIMDVERVCISSATHYHFFRSRPGSETTTVFDDMLFYKRKEQFQHILRVYEHWGIDDSESIGAIHAYYTNRLFQVIQEIVASGHLTRKQKRQQIKEVLNDKQTIESLKLQNESNIFLKLCVFPMKIRSVILSHLAGWGISIFKNNFASSFYKVRAKVVHKSR